MRSKGRLTAMRVLLLLLALPFAAHSMQVKKNKVILDNLDDYTRCFEKNISGSWCHKALTKWVQDHPKDSFKAGKLTRLYMNHWLAIPFFERAIKYQDFQCKDSDLKLAVIGGLNLPMTGNEKIIETASMLAFEKCPKELKDAVTEAARPDTKIFANICQKLDLSGIKKSRCEALAL